MSHTDGPQPRSKTVLTGAPYYLWAQIVLQRYAESTARLESPIQLDFPKVWSHLSFVNMN